MFDLRKDLNIYKSDVHEEWEKIISGLKTEGTNYIVPYFITLTPRKKALGAGSVYSVITLTLDLPISNETLSAHVLPNHQEIHYALDLLALMTRDPSLNGQTIRNGTAITKLVPIVDVINQLKSLSPESKMREVLSNIKIHCRHRSYDGEAAKWRTVVLFYALYGVSLSKQTTKMQARRVLDDVQSGDFGFRDVAHVIRLEAIVNGAEIQKAVTAEDFANVINEIDELLASCGRPVERPIPASVFLRNVSRLVKTSPLHKTYQNRR